MSVEQNKAVVVRFIEEVWQQGNLDVVDQLIGEKHIHHLARRDYHGAEGVRQLVTWFRAFLSDVTIQVNHLIGEGDHVTIHFTFQGTDTGGYLGRAPSGKQVTYAGIDIFRLENNKVVERWGIVDTATMLRQIGMLS